MKWFPLTALAACALVIRAPAQVPAKAPDFNQRVQAALAKSRKIVMKRLRRAHNGELALLCLAALHDEVPVTDKVFARALKRLAKGNFGRTYDIALRLMVMSECPAAAWKDRKKAVERQGKVLLKHMTKRGGFGYSKGDRRFDLSNTQYAVLGLRAAVSLGLKVTAEQWQRVLECTFAMQTEDGGFGYMMHRDPTESMTVAGIAVARICADHLDAKTVQALGVEKRLERAWKWVADHKGTIGDRDTANAFYYHYGLERAAILSDVTLIDKKDWYVSGAEMFLRMQMRNGGWHSRRDIVKGKGEDGADSVSTAFAVLFLRRKFQKKLAPRGPVTMGGSAPLHLLSPQSTPGQIKTSIESAVRRGDEALSEVLRALRSPVKLRRVAAAKALFRIAGEDFGFNPHLPPERSREALKRAEMWYLKRRRAPAKKGRDKGAKPAKSSK